MGEGGRDIEGLEVKTTPVDTILDEYSTKLQKVKYHSDLTKLPFDNSKIRNPNWNSPDDFYAVNFSRIVWDPRFEPDEATDNDLEPITKIIHTLAGQYNHICKRFDFSDNQYSALDVSVDGLRNVIENKKKLINLLAPGNYVAHGAYTDDLENILELGGLTSSMGRVNAGQIKKTDIPRWGKFYPNQPDKSAIFFYHWSNPRAGSYSAPFGEKKGSSDMCIIYPTRDLINNSGAILINFFHDNKNLEIGVTNSAASIRAGKLVDSSDDTTLLPFEKAFVLIPDDKEEEVKNILLNKGYTKEWIETHVKSLKIQRRTGLYDSRLNNMGEVISEKKDEINKWLQDNNSTVSEKISISSKDGNLNGLFSVKLTN